jgi:hypothetical protein
MLMTRLLYVTTSVLVILLNGTALALLLSDDRPQSSIVVAALVVGTVMWPLGLAMTYRIGQATARLRFVRERRVGRRALA